MMVNLRSKIKGFFAATPEPAEASLPTGDTAWSEESLIYSDNDFEKYNPDVLIGRKGFGIYRRMMIDEQVKAVVKFKRDAITSRDWYFDIDQTKFDISDEEKEKRIKLFNRIVEKMQGSWMDAINGVMSAIYNGFSMTEILFEMIEFDNVSWWGIEKLKLKPYDTFYFHVDEFGNIEKVVQKISSTEHDIDLRKFIHYIMNPDVDDHYGSSELREAYRSWFSKDIIIKFHNMWLEKHAGGFRWIQAKDGKSIHPSSPEYTKLQNVLGNIQTATGIILPNSVEMKSEYPSNNVAFKEAINDYDTSIARALLVPNLLGVSPQGDVGSYAQSTNQLKAFLWTLEADANRLEEVLNEQLFRPLGEVNFGDDMWPRFVFKPPAGTEKMEMIKTWKELVQGKAVRATDTDETHLRELLEFPEAGEEIIKAPQPSPLGDLQPTGGKDEEIKKQKEQEEQDAKEKELENENKKLKDKDEFDQKEKESKEAKKASQQESTILGNSSVTITAFDRATKRVDFAVIDKTSEAVSQEYTNIISHQIDVIAADLISKFRKAGEVDREITSNIRSLKVDTKLKSKLNGTVTSMLKEGNSIGTKHAAFEIDKAKSNLFSRDIDYKRLDMLAKDYLKITAFKITGNMISKITSIMEQAIINGSRNDRTLDEIEQEINEQLITKGYASEDKMESIQEKFAVEDVEVPNFVIASIIKTALFDSINTSRHEFFTDPVLENFVLGYEYSAIMDSRTTAICRHLDGDNAGNHSTEWYSEHPEFRPPNHFNCRSLLIPVTKEDTDEFVEGPTPRIQPQSGFS